MFIRFISLYVRSFTLSRSREAHTFHKYPPTCMYDVNHIKKQLRNTLNKT